jgi:hypothetical protein
MKRVTHLLLIAALATVASTARAQDPEAKTRAAKLNQEAADHAKRGEWSVAAAMLAEAYRLTRDPALLVNLGATELKAGRGVEALHHLQTYMSDPSADPKIKAGVSEHLLPHAMSMTAHLNIHFPPGGRLTVDGEVEQVEPNVGVTLVDVMPGDHTVEISASGSSSQQTVTAAAGASIEVQAFPQAPPAAAAPAAATAPSAGAAPSSDAAPTGEAPASHSFWTAGHIVPLGLLVGGVGAAVAGGVFLAGANSAASQASSCTPQPGCQDSLHSTYNSDNVLATSFFIGGGVLAAAAVVTWLVWPSPHAGSQAAARPARVLPFVTPGGAGVYGSF